MSGLSEHLCFGSGVPGGGGGKAGGGTGNGKAMIGGIVVLSVVSSHFQSHG
jgi:hypothetical protein